MTAEGGILTADAILDAAEDVLRRYGPGKATVLDVSKALGVSHGSVYRHFGSKLALRDAVAERWLARVSDPLALIVAEAGPAAPRLRSWLEHLATTKQRMARADPELFATFHQITAESRVVVRTHVDHLAGQMAQIIADGVASGEFAQVDPARVGRAFLQATTRFHHPAHAADWAEPASSEERAEVWSLLAAGLLARGAVTDNKDE